VPYPIEFRIAVAAAYDECGSSIEVAELFGCSESWVRRLVQRREATGGSLEPLTPKRPDTRKLDEQDLLRLRELIRDKPDLTLGELAAALGGKASVPTVWRATQALRLPLKKRRSMPPSRTAPTWPRRAPAGSSSSSG
jgi:transposase